MRASTQILKRVNDVKNAEPRPGEVWWMNVCQYDGSNQYKGRPVLIRNVIGSNVVCCQCTSKYHEGITTYCIMDPVSAGLAKTTYVKNQPLTVPRSRLSRRMGRLSSHDIRDIQEALA